MFRNGVEGEEGFTPDAQGCGDRLTGRKKRIHEHETEESLSATFTPERAARAVRAGVAAVLSDVTGVVVWLA